MFYNVTIQEMEELEKAGLATIVDDHKESRHNWNNLNSITVNGKTFLEEIYYKKHNRSGMFTSNGITSFFESEDGDVLTLSWIRYTKKGTIKGYEGTDRIMKKVFGVTK